MARGPSSLRGGRSALGARRLAAVIAAGLVAIITMGGGGFIFQASASEFFAPHNPFAMAYTELYFTGPSGASNTVFFDYDLCSRFPPASTRFPKGATVKVQWDADGGGHFMCKKLSFYRTPKCGGRPYLTLALPAALKATGSGMSRTARHNVLTRRALTAAQVPVAVKCELA
ncbi:hypothetical protein CLOM_g4666 [Closterium sp. NIES-68]|nr:hypothetical protein CLOM_g4666 [Closterium sp. NIES-68]GJP57696.1 hypothetical protein CLOP_g17112 [Closterium sp. NIES-67]